MKNKIFVGIALSIVVLLGALYYVSTNKTQIEGEKQIVMEKNEQKSYMDIEPKEAYELIQNTPNLVIIDVSPKYKEGHIPGAINYYLGDGSLAKAVPTLDKNLKYLVYCHVDSISIAGAQMLVDAGISDVYRLKGNYSAWVEAGYPVDK
ncbi:MAG TPA: rhodanese-like domain-containing protein [Spirochaetia bacterium]|nr:rhodanese-like domain-containing protein [Spirochaetia bacterium]